MSTPESTTGTKLQANRFIELSYPVDSSIPLWHTDKGFKITQIADVLTDGFALHKYEFGTGMYITYHTIVYYHIILYHTVLYSFYKLYNENDSTCILLKQDFQTDIRC